MHLMKGIYIIILLLHVVINILTEAINLKIYSTRRFFYIPPTVYTLKSI